MENKTLLEAAKAVVDAEPDHHGYLVLGRRLQELRESLKSQPPAPSPDLVGRMAALLEDACAACGTESWGGDWQKERDAVLAEVKSNGWGGKS